jgi:O-acetyl-ADP-ribose deacetylase (regulator of RNase III)
MSHTVGVDASEHQRLIVTRGDITHLEVDVIVNAANSSLLGGGGVDGAIHAAAGPELLAECRQLAGCQTGDAKLTHGYNLPARYIIHTVGPIWSGDGQRDDPLLASCYRRSLEIAEQNGLSSVAFPSISTGAYGFPIPRAAEIAINEIRAFLAAHELPALVTLVTFTYGDEKAYRRALEAPREYA